MGIFDVDSNVDVIDIRDFVKSCRGLSFDDRNVKIKKYVDSFESPSDQTDQPVHITIAILETPQETKYVFLGEVIPVMEYNDVGFYISNRKQTEKNDLVTLPIEKCDLPDIQKQIDAYSVCKKDIYCNMRDSVYDKISEFINAFYLDYLMSVAVKVAKSTIGYDLHSL